MKAGKRIGSLDLIKFIGAILIIFHHFQGDFHYDDMLIKFSGGKLFFGYVVEMFFMISGIVMSVKNEKYSNLCFEDYIGGRLLRIMPMATYSTLVFMILVVVYKIKFGIWYSCAPLSPLMIVKGLFLFYCGGPVKYENIEPNCVLWYLCVLIICYVIYWGLLRISKDKGIDSKYLFLFMVILGVSIASYGIDLPFLNTYTARGYIAFFIGVLLPRVYDAFPKKVFVLSSFVLLYFVIGMIIDPTLLLGEGLNQQLTLNFILYPAIILFLSHGLICDMFNNKVVYFLGNISFEMYLCQYHIFMLIHLLEDTGILQFPRNDVGMIVAALIIIMVSIIVNVFIEKWLYDYCLNHIKAI